MSTYKRAKLWNVPMVSILWIEACEKELKTVPPELHPPLNLDKYESALTLDLGTKKKTRKKLGVEATDSPGQTRKKKIEESMKPSSTSSKLNGAQKTPFQKKTLKRFGEDRDELSCQTISKEIEELKQPSASTTKKLNLTPKTPHEDSFIQALLTVAEDELKDFLNRPLTQPVDEDSVLDLPLSVRLLHKHVFERRARTSVKETSAIVEENIKKFTDNGRIKLRKLVFPSCEGENEAIKENIDINNGALSNDNEGTVKNLGGKYCIKFPHLAKHGLENDRKSAPAILGSVRSRRSAPAKLVRRRKPNRQKLNFENGNIDKFLVKTAGSGKNLKNNDRTSCDSSQKNVTGINTNQRNVLRNTDENKDKGISDNGENSNFTRPTYLQGVNVENNTQKRKRKLFTLSSNIYLTEPVNTSCEPSVVKCPYTDSPLKKKQNSELGNESTSKVFIKPSVPKHKFKENVPPVSSDSENIDSHRRGSSVLFVDDKVKKTNLRVAASIVCTSINRKDLETILAMTNLLGKFSLERMVSERTTHVVTCAARRTINLLKGIARGAWILKDDWIYKSFEAGKWLDEEPFELVEFSSAVKQCRIERIAFGPEFSLELFKDVGFIYVCKGTSPPTADLVELLRICGGKVVTNMNVADIIVGSKAGQKTTMLSTSRRNGY